MIRVLYPGSFDPITKGHMNIIDQSTNLFDEVLVAILFNPSKKNYYFSLDERLEIIKKLYMNNPKVKVITGEGAAVDLAILHQCKAIVRGLRSITDFEYEIQLASINKDMSEDKINTICLFADSRLQNVSSSAVREVFNLNKTVSRYVDPIVEEQMILKKMMKQCN